MAAKADKKRERLRWVEDLEPYPAVFLPVPEGGFVVFFPNFPGLKAYGVKLETAEKAAREFLTADLLDRLIQGEDAPRPSDPDKLIPDEDEPEGTRMMMLEPDKAALRKRLGLVKQEKGNALKSFGLYGR
jgi:predicted RNase H-like HicB family nuclease